MNKDRLFNRRKELGLTLEEVGKIVGVSKSTVKKWETGYIENMKRDKIALLAQALQTTPLFIMGIEETNSSSKITNLYTLSPDEELLIKKYKQIDSHGKHTVKTVLEMEYNRCNSDELNIAAHAKQNASQKDIQDDIDLITGEDF